MPHLTPTLRHLFVPAARPTLAPMPQPLRPVPFSHDYPAVSVLMPVINGARYLRAALRSIQRQTLQDFEFIIVDGGSTDGTLRILERAATRDPRLRIVHRPHSNLADALNAGLALTRAPLVARMDADDIAHPDRLAQQAAFLDREVEFLGCGTAVSLIDRHGAVVDMVSPPSDAQEIDETLMRGRSTVLFHSSLMVRRRALEEVGGYRRFAQANEDLDLYLRLSELGPLTNLAHHLLQCRVHRHSAQHRFGESRGAFLEAVIRDACRRRSLEFDPSQIGELDLPKPAARLHLEWAASAARLGCRLTALKHAVLGATLAPTDRTSYATLRTVIDYLWRPSRTV
jgi:hypothetical protein